MDVFVDVVIVVALLAFWFVAIVSLAKSEGRRVARETARATQDPADGE